MKKLIVVLAVVAMAGCTAKRQEVFSSEVIETSLESKKPEWVFKTFQVLDDSEGYLFSGGVTNVSEYALGVSEAKAEAIKNAIGSIQLKVRSEFSKFAEGSNMTPDLIGKFVSDGVAFIADSFYVSGIQQKQIYYEKERYNTEYMPHYNIWVLCYISGADYLKAKIDRGGW